MLVWGRGPFRLSICTRQVITLWFEDVTLRFTFQQYASTSCAVPARPDIHSFEEATPIYTSNVGTFPSLRICSLSASRSYVPRASLRSLLHQMFQTLTFFPGYFLRPELLADMMYPIKIRADEFVPVQIHG
ncbi:hypothetical protein EVAR_60822_1 [Eumeta japonica]|uniref:Uncharacterized protein n=1 Tax=Eumeta variegata TaxID=151549 RepID=A0A4C1ZWU6_EUMVA|nr:hypothetical protein EVAR_60822_1 [Eumeta japonica]